ncbi:hypothetical protein BKA66DRAFT_433502 [Pyrenochaeta sp. MPI-SDFR-AT-0127]|nr:hypothetical protein BKA66DRAFT_433502 [Pyrenochaeta sp. MPI-SDFR-AT-0127]
MDQLERKERQNFATRLIISFNKTFIEGWRAGLLRAFVFSLAAFIANIAVYAWLFATYNGPGGTATVMTGKCEMVRQTNTGIHAALNVVSTLVLSASTYAMQGLTAPTRKEVNVAHGKGKWVEIGTASIRNLFHVRRRNIWIWILLAVTGLPFHLFFNAVFFTTSQTNQYAVAVVDQSFFDNIDFQPSENNSSPELFEQWTRMEGNCDGADCAFDIATNISVVIQLLQDVRNSSRDDGFTRMEPSECMQKYASGFMRDYSDVAVVSSRVDAESPVHWTRYPQRSLSSDKENTHPDPFHWVCHDLFPPNRTRYDRCGLKLAEERFDFGRNWTVYDSPVSHCFARKAPDACQLQFNEWLMLAVVVFGGVKVLTICYLVFWRPEGPFLRTLGDAIASFLEEEDPTTKDMCLVSSKQFRKHGLQTSYGPQIFTNVRPRWLSSANTLEFFITIGASAAYIIILAVQLFIAIEGAAGFAWSIGLGVADIQSLASFQRDNTRSAGIVPTLLVANLPQLGFSILFVAYTNTWSKLLVAKEFDRLTESKKGLRVSEQPQRMQRTTHFFTLPMRYALPLIACSAMLHWLCSQSLFMVRIDGVDLHRMVDSNDQLVRLGYSATGIVAIIGVSFGLMVTTVCMGAFRKMRTGLGETSMSFIISAACHPRRYEPELWLKEVQWGDVADGPQRGDGDERGVRHCAFTSEVARQPIEGQAYQ